VSPLLAQRYAQWLLAKFPGTEFPVAGARVRQGFARALRYTPPRPEVWAALEHAWQTTPERVWIWSDLHLFHANIIRHSQRPTENVTAMNQQLLASAQARVNPNDWLVCLGDLSLGTADDTASWLAQCPGRKVLLLGNHDVDRQQYTRWPAVWAQFEAIDLTRVWAATPHAPELWLTHYPLGRALVPEGVLNVHGHIHTRVLEGPFLNVSVEQQGLAPARLLDRVTQTGARLS
jgi:calcineurin-like phosphoesterase family protein